MVVYFAVIMHQLSCMYHLSCTMVLYVVLRVEPKEVHAAQGPMHCKNHERDDSPYKANHQISFSARMSVL